VSPAAGVGCEGDGGCVVVEVVGAVVVGAEVCVTVVAVSLPPLSLLVPLLGVAPTVTVPWSVDPPTVGGTTSDGVPLSDGVAVPDGVALSDGVASPEVVASPDVVASPEVVLVDVESVVAESIADAAAEALFWLDSVTTSAAAGSALFDVEVPDVEVPDVEVSDVEASGVVPELADSGVVVSDGGASARIEVS
jgi:hypothetical protein